MKALRVAVNAMTLPANLAGIGFYTCKLLEALSASDAIGGMTLFTNPAAAASLPPLPRKVEVSAIPAGSIAAKVAASQFSLPRRLRGFDLLHSVGNIACLATSLPQVVTVHDLCHKIIPSRFTLVKRMYLDWGMRFTAMGRSRIICVSESTRRDLVRFHPGTETRAVVVHSACKYAVSEMEASPRQGFLFVGTLEPGKNLDFALRALALLRGRGRQAALKVIGAKGWKQSHIPALVEKLGLADIVEFAGYLDDEGLRAAYRSAQCLIFPSAYEGFGFPILEAQSQGCPVIAADNSCQREIGGEGCVYFRDGDLEGLAGLMEGCLQGGNGTMPAAARGFANCRRFSWEKSAAGTLEVYRQAMAAIPAGSA
jgi:glycosyltransferase involved in cell wall biosynthesis